MLEATVVLELALGKYVEASIIAGLLAFNAVLGFFQEGRAQATLAALKSRLALNASVRRDNAWRTIPAAGLVPGDKGFQKTVRPWTRVRLLMIHSLAQAAYC